VDDHVHVIVQPLADFRLEKIVQAWKSVSAHRINRLLEETGPVWQPEYLDRIIRDEEELLQKCEYVLNNPAKRWPEISDYLWVYCSLLA
jgi:REP element-mobilizing transposase RayT